MDRGEFPHLTDSQFGSVRKMVDIFGGDALRSLAAAMPAEQVERIEAFDTYERGLIAHVQWLQVPVAEMKPAQPKPLRLKVNPYEGKGGREHPLLGQRGRARDGRGSNLDRATSDRFRPVQPGRSGEDLGVHARSNNAGLFHKLGLAVSTSRLPPNYEYRQRSYFLSCKQGKHEYIQEMRALAANLVGNPLPEHIKVTVFMDGLKVGPSHTQLFRVRANTMEEAIQIALQDEYSHRQARVLLRRCGKATMRRQAQCKELQQHELAQGWYPWNWVWPYRAPSVATD
ncbi:LOW QUALITY PROTEIN: Gag protein, partial [Phytophthora palmivora]